MTVKPGDLPRWATDGGAAVEEPSEIKKDSGWVVEKPPHQFFNWLQLTTYQWINYFNQFFDASNNAVLPEDAYIAGKVGIGTLTPAADIEIQKSVAAGAVAQFIINTATNGVTQTGYGQTAGTPLAYTERRGSALSSPNELRHINNSNAGQAWYTNGIQRMLLGALGEFSLNGIFAIKYAQSGSISAGGTLDLDLGATLVAGILVINHESSGNAAARTDKIYVTFNRLATSYQSTQIGTQDGATDEFTFTLSNPSLNVIRLTNTEASASRTQMLFFGLNG